MLRVVRTEAANEDRAPTETQLDGYRNFDEVIDNKGTKVDLYGLVEAFLRRP